MAGIALACLLALAPHAAPARAATPITVSLTFDDGSATEYFARSQLSSHAMTGTFYVNTSRVGSSDYYMTWQEIHDLAGDGNEIGGHTAMHVDLTKTDADEAKRQICIDRVNLVNQGLPAPTDFAYPYGAYNSTVQSWVQGCGYNSARSVVPAVSETVPPADPYAIHQAPGTDLTSLKNEVTAAESQGTGGWVPLVFHQICNACDTDWISQSDFGRFLDWLQGEVQSGAVVVKTVRQVIGGPVKPPVDGPAPPPAPNGWNALRDSSLENDADGNSLPDCWVTDSFGTNTPSWSRTTDAHTGSFAERVDVTGFQSGDAKLVNAEDLGFCTPTVTPGHRYAITAWYESTAPVTFEAFTRDAAGEFGFWTGSNSFPASSTWTKATWTTPVIPAGVNGLSFGLAITANGSLTVDDLGLDDANPTGGPDTTPPTVSLTSPTGGEISGTTALTADASDGVAVDHVDFLVDGSVVGTTAIGPYTFRWSSRSVGNGTHTLRARAVDTAGNTTTTPPTTVTVANSVVNLVSNPSLESATGGTPTCWQLAGFGTNEFTWTRTNDAHTGSFAENLNVTSVTSGDRKLITLQDTGTCAVTAQPGHSYTVSNWYKTGLGGLPMIFAYYRNSAGTWTFWANSQRFPASTDWAQATWSTPPVPDGATAISIGMGLNVVGSVTMDDFAVFDNAPPPDTTPPTSSIICGSRQGDDGSCISGYYNAPVPVTLTATDDVSGVASIKYTTDGSDPSATNGKVYSGQFTVGSTATVKYRAFDNAGNAEDVHSQLIRVDTSAPTSSISCNGGTCSSGFYGDTVSVRLSASDTGGSDVASIVYTTDGSTPTQTNGTTYTGAFVVTATTTVKYRAFDNAGNAEATNTKTIEIDESAPVSTIACNGGSCGGTLSGPVSVTLSADDGAGGSGVDKIVYTTDGSDPSLSNGTTYTGAFSLNSSTTVKYRAYDEVGNAEPINTRTVTITVTLPKSTIKCNATTCASTYYTAAVSVALSATDVGGPGVASIRYTTDGSDPSQSNGKTYTGAFGLTGNTTVKYRAYDTAGNAEAINAQVIHVDVTAPQSTIVCNGGSCTGWYKPGAAVTLSATDADSGVASIRYTTNGTDPSQINGVTYTAPFTLNATTTVRYRAYDNVGHAEAVKAQQVRIDGTLPSASITSPTAGALVSGTVSVTTNVSDNGAIDHVELLVDGQSVATDAASPYTFPWDSTSVADGTHALAVKAVDAAGNARTSASVSVIVTNDNLLPNPSLEAATGNLPACWIVAGTGTNTFTASRSTSQHSGSFAETLTINSRVSGDRELVSAQDTGTCAPAATAGHTYTVTAWYRSTFDQPSMFAYYRNGAGAWIRWAQSPLFPATGLLGGYRQAVWTTTALPTGAVAISAGMGLTSTGSVTMDDFGLFDTR